MRLIILGKKKISSFEDLNNVAEWIKKFYSVKVNEFIIYYFSKKNNIEYQIFVKENHIFKIKKDYTFITIKNLFKNIINYKNSTPYFDYHCGDYYGRQFEINYLIVVFIRWILFFKKNPRLVEKKFFRKFSSSIFKRFLYFPLNPPISIYFEAEGLDADLWRFFREFTLKKIIVENKNVLSPLLIKKKKICYVENGLFYLHEDNISSSNFNYTKSYNKAKELYQRLFKVFDYFSKLEDYNFFILLHPRGGNSIEFFQNFNVIKNNTKRHLEDASLCICPYSTLLFEMRKANINRLCLRDRILEKENMHPRDFGRHIEIMNEKFIWSDINISNLNSITKEMIFKN